MIINSERALQEHIGQVTRDFRKHKYIGVKITKQKRSIISNSLQFHWYKELEQQGDMTLSQYRNYCKWHFGCALKAANDSLFGKIFASLKQYYTYEQCLKIMGIVEVTSTFDPETMMSYLNEIKNHYVEQGFVLTSSEDIK